MREFEMCDAFCGRGRVCVVYQFMKGGRVGLAETSRDVKAERVRCLGVGATGDLMKSERIPGD